MNANIYLTLENQELIKDLKKITIFEDSLNGKTQNDITSGFENLLIDEANSYSFQGHKTLIINGSNIHHVIFY